MRMGEATIELTVTPVNRATSKYRLALNPGTMEMDAPRIKAGM
ncbi:hypothetical protein Rhow_008361 [Rhodococcus wratislaviensis]|uniref:Uncharacterized protein n=1 Tax=Rhodococcus wratislaviensis TaxID=44752 RepID=A0A402CKD5_RHOWR|nr:hypothetical protein Rhow_008361 [Rhodococcus wratislaviensis]